MSKATKRKRRIHHDPLLDDRGFPDQQSHFESILDETKTGRLLRKRLHAAPPLESVDPNFGEEFDESKHGEHLRSDLNIDHLSSAQQSELTGVIKEFYRVFSKSGVTTPVKDYECHIDTGTARPIACRNPTFGPLETPVMEKAIAKLVELGHAEQIWDGEWLSKPLLAPKPHQENVTDIDNFVWRFCVNYVPLNSVTKVIAMPIPRCDEAVGNTFGGSPFRWLMDAISGYNQISVAKSSRDKLAFAGPNCSKYTYRVMPFGPINGPSIFIIFVHDMDSSWKCLAGKRGIIIDRRTGSVIIVDDIMSWAPTFELFIAYLRCQLAVCLSQNLSLSLKKCLFCPPRLEFVGVDVTDDGNRPAQSKHDFLRSFPPFEIVRDISSFLGFLNFYSKWIPCFEHRVAPLRALCKDREQQDSIASLMTEPELAARRDLISAIVSDPVIARFDHSKRCYLLTDFSGKGFGYDLCQPSDDPASLAAMNREIAGGDCEFLKPKSNLELRSTGFGSRASRGRESSLHSHLGEAFALDWAINKCRGKLWGARFTSLTDCYALRFILSYDGPNKVLLRLQMRLMLWSFDIYHRPGTEMTSPDYWSRLHADLCFDPFTRDYLNRSSNLRLLYPPVNGPMRPENMPDYRAPRVRSTLPAARTKTKPGPTSSTSARTPTPVDSAIAPILTSMLRNNSGGHHFCLQVVPILTGHLTAAERTTCSHIPFFNHSIPALAAEVISLSFAIYGFNSGHFISNSFECPFDICLAADPLPGGRALFKQFTNCPSICTSSADLLRYASAATSTTAIHGYIIHTPLFPSASSERSFWSLQSKIVRTLHKKRRLVGLMVHIHAHCDIHHVGSFRRALSRCGWIFSSTDTYYPDFGDSISASATFLLGHHKGASVCQNAIRCPRPPSTQPLPLAAFIHPPFNVRTYATSKSKTAPDFSDGGYASSVPIVESSSTHKHRATRLYNIHRSFDDRAVSAGSGVYDLDGLCPPKSSANNNLFASTFGIEYPIGPDTFVRPFSTYEYATCFRMSKDVTYSLSQPDNYCLLDTGVPSRTAQLILSSLLTRLEHIRTESFELFDPSLQCAPAAFGMIPSYTSGAIGSRLPDHDLWCKSIESDPMTEMLTQIVANPSLAEDKLNLAKLHSIYRHPARQGHFSMKNGILYMKEIFAGDTKYVNLQVVPASLCNIVFVAFHANPIGGHLDAFRTFHRIRQRFFWPGMFQYCKRMIKACPGCSLSNITQRRSADLVYSFPIDAPMNVLHVDIYAAGAEINFEGNRHYLVAACGMTAFGICEPTPEQNAATFAAALMRIWLRFGFSHTIVVDKDSKFLGVFVETARLLNINIHVLSGENHNPMLVERINRFLNSCLTIFCNERGSVRVAEEGILMALYAWNSAPIIGTDISRSLIVVGREFRFPIDFSAEQHAILTSNPASVQSFAADQATLLSCGRLIARELINQHRAYHREFVNERRPNPRLYSPGDRVFAKRSVRSDKKKGRVDKLMEAWTGPWEVTEKAKGSSYLLKHLVDNRVGKRHAAHLSPFPHELLAFMPIDGADNRFGQLHRPIQENPYKNAGLKGFAPCQPVLFCLMGSLATGAHDPQDIKFPTLAELNAELDDWSDAECASTFGDDTLCIPVDAFPSTPLLPQPPLAPPAPPLVPSISALAASIVASTDKLFIVAHRVPGSTVSEWVLVRIALRDSLSQHPPCLQDGRFLVDFYTCHPADTLFNAVNQRYWLEYHPAYLPLDPFRQRTTHLIRPSASSAQFAVTEGLTPFRQWIRLTDVSTYICGPFDFAVVNNRQSKDRISLEHWTKLHQFKHLFTNMVPSLDLPQYSVHLGLFHSQYTDPGHSARYVAYSSSPSSPTSV